MKITVVYKSGAKVTFDCEKIKVTHGLDGDVRSMTWEQKKEAKVKPLFIGLNDIAAVYEGIA